MRHLLPYLKDIVGYAPADEDALFDAADALDVEFPVDYRYFMTQTNGAEGSIGENSYLVLWTVQELVERNEGYAVAETFPDLVYIGSNGADIAYAYNKETQRYLAISFLADSVSEGRDLGESMEEFFKSLYEW